MARRRELQQKRWLESAIPPIVDVKDPLATHCGRNQVYEDLTIPKNGNCFLRVRDILNQDDATGNSNSRRNRVVLEGKHRHMNYNAPNKSSGFLQEYRVSRHHFTHIQLLRSSAYMECLEPYNEGLSLIIRYRHSGRNPSPRSQRNAPHHAVPIPAD